MGTGVVSEIDRTQVRLAELVAALSLGIDLGFGQPMEHVLRQCLIALRLAEGIGLDEEQRAVVYYTALLVNVGCHSDAHEQAKWFGDDIALEVDQVRPRAAQRADGRRGDAPARRREPAAAPLPARARVRALRAPRGRRHDRPPRRDRADAGRAARAPRTTCSRRSAPRTSGGTDAAGRASSRARSPARRRGSRSSPSSSRSRTGSAASTRRAQLARERRGEQFDPALADLVEAEADVILVGPRRPSASWDAVIDAEPALAVVLVGRALRRRAARDRQLRRPEVAVLPRARRGRRRARRGRGPAARARRRQMCALLRRAGSGARPRPARRLERDPGTSAGRSAPASGSACGCSPT